MKPPTRPELGTLPERIAKLPVHRGYPVPWFVDWTDGEPEFRAMDPDKWRRAVRDRVCWVCGEPLGKYLAFVIGPMCGVNRTTTEPPCHLDCAEWSARFCPFLSRPHMVRREDDAINAARFLVQGAGLPILRNPGVACVWITLTYTTFRDPRNRPLIELGEPVNVRWFAEGRKASRAEVNASIESGMPALREMADKDPIPGAHAALDACVTRLEPHLPRA